MAKTLVIAEKPSVGQDLARVLPGPFEKHTGAGERTTRWLEGPDHLVTWAVGHLVQLAEPDEYDDKYKKWRMADLPIVPRHFKLVVRDERSQKQMAVVRDLLKRDDVDRILNACDAGREGELIFKWIIEKARGGNGSVKGKPIERLWLSSMTKQAMLDAPAHTRPDEEMKPLEEGAESRRRGRRDRRRGEGQARRDHEARQAQAARAPAAPLRPHLAPARGEHALRLLRPPHARGRPALLRGAQGPHVSAHELALPDERHGLGDQADRRPGRARRAGVRQGRRVRHGPRPVAARPRRRRREGRRPPRDH